MPEVTPGSQTINGSVRHGETAEPTNARVSTAKQDLDRQVDALTTAGIPAERD